MNQLSWEKRVAMKRLLAAGSSNRAIQAALGVATYTVSRYKKLWAVSATCPCGQSAGHQGWCKYRLAFSPNRRGWLADHWTKRSDSELSVAVDQAVQQSRQLGHRLGLFVWNSQSSTTIAYALCRLCGKTVRINDGHLGERFDGTAIRQKCFTKAQLAAHRAAHQEMKAWRKAKRELRALRAHLRASLSPTTASTPPPTSCG